MIGALVIVEVDHFGEDDDRITDEQVRYVFGQEIIKT